MVVKRDEVVIEAHKQQTISLCYWNICSVTNKLENDGSYSNVKQL